jgi:hypothetical protein
LKLAKSSCGDFQLSAKAGYVVSFLRSAELTAEAESSLAKNKLCIWPTPSQESWRSSLVPRAREAPLKAARFTGDSEIRGGGLEPCIAKAPLPVRLYLNQFCRPNKFIVVPRTTPKRHHRKE